MDVYYICVHFLLIFCKTGLKLSVKKKKRKKRWCNFPKAAPILVRTQKTEPLVGVGEVNGRR